jgi:hypothetical protein
MREAGWYGNRDVHLRDAMPTNAGGQATNTLSPNKAGRDCTLRGNLD